MEVSWIEHNNKKILFSNYEGCITADEMIGILHKERNILLTQERKVLVILIMEILLVLHVIWTK